MSFTSSDSGLTRNLQRFADLPNKYCILCNPTAPFTSALTMADAIAAESTGVGYLRQAYAPGAATYDATQVRAELGSVSCVFSAGATGYSFTAAVLLSGASAVASKSIVAVDTGSNALTATGHGLSVGDKVLISADPSGVLPVPLVANTTYYIEAATTDSFTLKPSIAGSQIDLTSNGTLPLRLRYANGEVELYQIYSTTTVPASGSHTVAVSINTAGGDTASVDAA